MSNKVEIEINRTSDKVVIALNSSTCNAWVGLNSQQAMEVVNAIFKQVQALAGEESPLILPPSLN